MRCGMARDGGAEKDAEIRPVKATNNAKMRMAAFIFGNLIYSNVKGNFLTFPKKAYSIFYTKSSVFIYITKYNRHRLLTSFNNALLVPLVTDPAPSPRPAAAPSRMVKLA
jgi:hypothetical protein